MIKNISKLILARPVAVVVSCLFVALVAGYYGVTVPSHLTVGGFSDPNAESSLAANQLSEHFPTSQSNVIIVVTSKRGSVTDPQVVSESLLLEKQLREADGLKNVYSYWSAGMPPSLTSTKGDQALILGNIEGSEKYKQSIAKNVTERLTTNSSNITADVGGHAEVGRQLNTQIKNDLTKAESIAFPITLIVLLFVFGSALAAALPLLVGALAVIGSMFVLLILTKIEPVSIYALNLIVMLGLGLAIDYSLFIVSRFREELRKQENSALAIQVTMKTAGKTVAYSSLTVAVSLATLIIFPQSFLRSIAFAGVAISLIAALISITFLPAVLYLLGNKVNALPVWRSIAEHEGSEFWGRLSSAVMKRPITIALLVVAGLIFLGFPFRDINLGRADERSLPSDSQVRIVHSDLRNNFISQEAVPLRVVASSVTTASDISSYASRLSTVKNVSHVESSVGVFVAGRLVSPMPEPSRFQTSSATWLSVVGTVDPYSSDGINLTRAVRSVPAPFEVKVGGDAAEVTDLIDSILNLIPIAAGLIAFTTFVLLFLMFGSILVPIKALIINTLSLSATFGMIVWVFQQGHLTDILSITATGMIEASMPILMFCLAFGLSMDYEVFLLSRIKERYDTHGDNSEAITYGLSRTGGIVTAAAVAISIVFIAFASSGISIIKMLGLGLALAVLLDAFIIRGTLVPALMHLAGKANWWAPPYLKRLHHRFRIGE